MPLSRRAAVLGAIASPLARAAWAETMPSVRVAVLRFGTVAWEVDVIRRHGFDRANGVSIEPVDFAAAPAAQVALQAGAVDVAVQDWLWVARQRADGADWTFDTFSTAIGAIVAPPDSPVYAVADLPGRRLGIAGSPLDKSWLILRAYAQKVLRLDLDAVVTKTFGSPPLLAAQMGQGRLDAILTFWPYAARATAAGARRVFGIDEAVRGLGIVEEMPVAGYAFSEKWAKDNPTLVSGLLAAAAAARGLLGSADGEWVRMWPITNVPDAAEYAIVRQIYRAGIPHATQTAHAQAAGRLFEVLAAVGGPALVGSAHSLPPGTFWQAS